MKEAKHKGKGNTFRKCISCRGKHSNKKFCPNPNNYMGKKNSALPNFSKYRHCKRLASPDEFHHFSQMYIKVTKNPRSNNTKSKNKLGDKSLSLPDKKKKKIESIECPICLTSKGSWKKLGCKHKICNECYNTTLITDTLKDQCPLCRADIFSENFADYYITNLKYGNSRNYVLVDTSEFDSDSYIDSDSDSGIDSDIGSYSDIDSNIGSNSY